MAHPGKAVYSGLYRHNLDDKSRLTIPSEWRYTHDESDIFLALPHHDGFIAILPPAEIEKLHATVGQVALSDGSGQEFVASFFARTQSFTFDKAGRVGLRAELLKHAGIDKNAVLVGSMTKFHLYAPSSWAKVEARTAAANNGDAMRRIGL